MKTVSKNEIKKALFKVGVRVGQVIFVYSDLGKIGKVAEVRSRDEFCQAYFESILEILGPEGTLVVPTYTTQIARFDLEFVHEETPSLMGLFSEFVRHRPGSIRSLHPINSVCAVGKYKEFICSNNGTNNYGWDSPFHRMLLKQAKILCIGLESGYVVGIAHHLEAAYDLPYVYNKLLKWSPVVNGIRDQRVYFATVRHLELDIDYDLTAFVRHIRKLGGVSSAELGESWVHLADYEQVFLEGARLLSENPYLFLKFPPTFTYGKVPFDGPSASLDGIAAKDDGEKVRTLNWQGFYLRHKYAGGDEDELVGERTGKSL